MYICKDLGWWRGGGSTSFGSLEISEEVKVKWDIGKHANTKLATMLAGETGGSNSLTERRSGTRGVHLGKEFNQSQPKGQEKWQVMCQKRTARTHAVFGGIRSR